MSERDFLADSDVEEEEEEEENSRVKEGAEEEVEEEIWVIHEQYDEGYIDGSGEQMNSLNVQGTKSPAAKKEGVVPRDYTAEAQRQVGTGYRV